MVDNPGFTGPPRAFAPARGHGARPAKTETADETADPDGTSETPEEERGGANKVVRTERSRVVGAAVWAALALLTAGFALLLAARPAAAEGSSATAAADQATATAQAVEASPPPATAAGRSASA